MNKPESLLTDAEMHTLICGNPCTLGLSIARLKDFIRQVEKAVVAKQSVEQEPIGYLHANEISFLSAKGITAEQAQANDYSIPLYTYPAPNPKVFSLTIPEAEAYIKQLESENDAKYVAFGADAYYHSCKELELWQQERLNKGLDEGPQGTLMGWMNWAQEFMDSFRVPASVTQLQSEVEQMVLMLEDKEWTDHCGKSALGQRLEWAITALHNEAQNNQIIIPDGWQLVPKDLNNEMRSKFWEADEKYQDGLATMPDAGYKALLAAAPKYTGG